MIGDHLDQYTFEYLIEEALSLAPPTVDQRQGSIIYDTSAVSDVQLAQAYIVLKGFYIDTYALTAESEYLDMRVQERGVYRYPSTAAVKLGVFKGSNDAPAMVPLGSDFSTESDTKALTYTVTEVSIENGQVVPGSYLMQCKTLGTIGNDYTGELLRISNVSGLSSAEMTDLIIPGQDMETDDDLRARYIELINRPPFGGNIAHYKKWILDLKLGVGGVQVYPVWAGGGTVKCSIIGADYLPANPALIDKIQTIIDPEQNQGVGLGLAPIGAMVTVATPDTSPVAVNAALSLGSGVTLAQVQSDVDTAIEGYLKEQRKGFGKAYLGNFYSINIYRAQIIAALVDIDGILNVTNLRLNGVDADLTLTQSAQVQYLPIIGTVTLHEI